MQTNRLIVLAVTAIAFLAMAATAVRVAIFLVTAPAFFARPECPPIEPGTACRANEGDTLLLALALFGIPFFLAASIVLIRGALMRTDNYSPLEHRRRSIGWALGAAIPVAGVALIAAVVQAPMALLLLAVTPVEGLGVDDLAQSSAIRWGILVTLTLGPLVTMFWPRVHPFTCLAVATLGILIAGFTLTPTVLVLYAAAVTMSGVHALCVTPYANNPARGLSAQRIL